MTYTNIFITCFLYQCRTSEIILRNPGIKSRQVWNGSLYKVESVQLDHKNTFPMSNFNGINTQWTQVPGPELAAYSPLFKKFMIYTNESLLYLIFKT